MTLPVDGSLAPVRSHIPGDKSPSFHHQNGASCGVFLVCRSQYLPKVVQARSDLEHGAMEEGGLAPVKTWLQTKYTTSRQRCSLCSHLALTCIGHSAPSSADPGFSLLTLTLTHHKPFALLGILGLYRDSRTL